MTVVKAPEYLGEGVLLNLHMDQPGDGRMSEVFLDTESMANLYTLLEPGKERP